MSQSTSDQSTKVAALNGLSKREVLQAKDLPQHDQNCANCSTSDSALWRRYSNGVILCNSCGLHLSLHGSPRPQQPERESASDLIASPTSGSPRPTSPERPVDLEASMARQTAGPSSPKIQPSTDLSTTTIGEGTISHSPRTNPAGSLTATTVGEGARSVSPEQQSYANNSMVGTGPRSASPQISSMADLNDSIGLEATRSTPERPAIDQRSLSPNNTSASQKDKGGDTHEVLKSLNVDIRSQEDQEREVAAKLADAYKKSEDERDQKLIDKTLAKMQRLGDKKRQYDAQLEARGTSVVQKAKLRGDIHKILEEVEILRADMAVTQDRLKAREVEHAAAISNIEVDYSQVQKPGESRNEFLVRTGKITPFALAKAQRQRHPQSALEEALREAEDADEEKKQEELMTAKPQSHQHLQKPGFSTPTAKIDYSKISARKRASLTRNKDIDATSKKRPRDDVEGSASKRSRTPEYVADTDLGMFDSRVEEATSTSAAESRADSAKTSTNKQAKRRESDEGGWTPEELSNLSTPDWSGDSFVENGAVEDEDEDSDEFRDVVPAKKQPKSSRKSKSGDELVAITDDGDEKAYQKRLQKWTEDRSSLRHETESDGEVDNRPEWEKPCPTAEGHAMDGDLTVPGDIWPVLFDYQKTGLKWLTELQSQGMGGILADEMGLGKTVQIIAEIATLHHSGKLAKPVLIVCPATVMQQWANEFHTWWPALRVSILHSSGAGMVNLTEESRHDDDVDVNARGRKVLPKAQRAAQGIVDRVLKKGHILITTYSGLETYNKLLTDVEWQYAVLDEGHKIKNPDTAVTYLCKSLTTRNRIILSGTPMQNNMTEIWSLMDFVHPGILGTLVDFKVYFEDPIKRGGHKSCTNLERKVAENTATVLKNTISQQFLQRFKVDVASDLPKKTEQTLCCKFTKAQAKAYRNALSSDDVARAKAGRSKPMEVIDKLTKICNHPDLLNPALKKAPGYNWGDPNKSGKMEITRKLLELWKAKGEKMLLFSQGKQMMDILEKFMKDMGNIRYLVMHGETPMSKRSVLVDQFNNDPEIDVFLLSTRVGGLGLNLTAANGVIIFDPSWNPSTDAQARERAWRLGQQKPVTVFRLMCKGAIEEKMYQRQLYKTKLTEKVLKDATSDNIFDPADLQDLFSFENDAPDGKAADYTQGAERRIKADWASDGKYNNERIENGTALEKDGAAQARFAMDPKKFRQKPTAEEAAAAEQNRKRKAAEAWGDWDTEPQSEQQPTPPKTDKSGISPDISPPSAKRQKMAELEEEQWHTLEQVKTLDGVKGMYATQYRDEPVSPTNPHSADFTSTVSQQKTLDSIFATSGVHSILSHDDILRGKKEKPDMRYILADAEKAKKEVEAIIKRNAEAAKRQAAGTVTWTGRHGEAGRRVRTENVSRNHWRVGGERSARSTANPSRFQTPISRFGAGPGSSNPTSRDTSAPNSRLPSPAPPGQAPRKMFHDQIRAYIMAQGGSVPREMVSRHFEHLTRDRKVQKVFMSELLECCNITDRGAGRKNWVLKEKYR